jgi:hypothetical protein
MDVCTDGNVESFHIAIGFLLKQAMSTIHFLWAKNNPSEHSKKNHLDLNTEPVSDS